MILAHSNHPETYHSLLTHPLWQEALNWIAKEAAEKPDGDYEIQGKDMYASVQTALTVPRKEALFEAHRQYIDLHYCLTGGEIIEWAPVQALEQKTQFDTEKDYALYEPPGNASALVMTPGVFAIFLPADAHMPKVADNTHKEVRKVVVKIRARLLQEKTG
jgi:biofilm protein TabA